MAITLDSDQSRAIDSRTRWFDEFARVDAVVAGAHTPFPGFGHIDRRGAGFGWTPLR